MWNYKIAMATFRTSQCQDGDEVLKCHEWRCQGTKRRFRKPEETRRCALADAFRKNEKKNKTTSGYRLGHLNTAQSRQGFSMRMRPISLRQHPCAGKNCWHCLSRFNSSLNHSWPWLILPFVTLVNTSTGKWRHRENKNKLAIIKNSGLVCHLRTLWQFTRRAFTFFIT